MCLSGLMDEMFKWCRDSATHPQLLRFMAHLMLFFRALGITEKVSFISVCTALPHCVVVSKRLFVYQKAESLSLLCFRL